MRLGCADGAKVEPPERICELIASPFAHFSSALYTFATSFSRPTLNDYSFHCFSLHSIGTLRLA